MQVRTPSHSTPKVTSTTSASAHTHTPKVTFVATLRGSRSPQNFAKCHSILFPKRRTLAILKFDATCLAATFRDSLTRWLTTTNGCRSTRWCNFWRAAWATPLRSRAASLLLRRPAMWWTPTATRRALLCWRKKSTAPTSASILSARCGHMSRPSVLMARHCQWVPICQKRSGVIGQHGKEFRQYQVFREFVK